MVNNTYLGQVRYHGEVVEVAGIFTNHSPH